MFLKTLKILNGGSIINEISFHKGINLIVDETPEDSLKTATGNNVGKTTVLRLVDYCFGGDGKNIYQDTEFKKQPNTNVENFLKNNNIIIEVELLADLDNPNSESVLIRKNFLLRNKKIQELNKTKIQLNSVSTHLSRLEIRRELIIESKEDLEKGYDLIVTNIEGNPSTGKKKGQIAAFDFAYIKFADSLDINCLHFVMYDQLENIHDNQLNTIVEVANCLNGQYIVPILRDKVPDNIDISEYEVISLSQTNKLFRIP